MNKEYIEEVVFKAFSDSHNKVLTGTSVKTINELIPLLVAATANAVSNALTTLLLEDDN